jgi:DNA-binding CsgD family transcriptional regulator
MTEKNYRHLENKTRRQHYVTILVERLSGKTPEQIAASLKMTAQSVDRDLGYVNREWSRIFSPNGVQIDPKTPQPPTVSSWRTKAICCTCGANIAAEEERVLVAALELVNEIDDGDADYKRNGVSVPRGARSADDIGVAKNQLLHCCGKCSPEVSEFTICNPAFVEKEQRGSLRAEEQKEFDQLPDEKLVDKDSAAAAVRPLPAVRQSGEEAQKMLLDKFLKDPKSRGMAAAVRTATKMWIDGASQNEIARKLGRDQATVSRMIAGARKRAYAQS